MPENQTSGEVNSIILGLVKENREDTKEILKQQAVTNAVLAQHVDRLSDGDRRMDGFEREVATLKAKLRQHAPESHTDYLPTVAQPTRPKAEATTMMSRRLDSGLLIKIGLLAGAAAAGWAGARAVP